MEDEKLEYLSILKGLMELPFQVGKTLLVDFLVGDYKNKSVTKNCLDELDNFEALSSWDKGKVSREIDRLVTNGMIEMVISDYNRFIKVMSLTIKGRNEITHPTMGEKKLINKFNFKKTEISEGDLLKFEEFKNFLRKFNDEQKKAVVCDASNVLCIAGAGSGKTTVLTKRIESLVKHRGVEPSKILAVTFTRKAREEMGKRLRDLGITNVAVHTFNSFCETVLRRHGNQIYGRSIRVQSYQDKILGINMALANMGLEMGNVIDEYFSASQKKFKTGYQLANSFMNDCFSVMDYFKISNKEAYNFSANVDAKDRVNADRVFNIIKYLKEYMETQGLRDYTDQVIDAIKFFEGNEEHVPVFEHVLIDEYQDVNSMQVKLIELLKPLNLFAVGDPRQSIFGWRGSDINYILNFEKHYGEAEVIHLTKNYRSDRDIVRFMNESVRDMGLPDLEHHHEFDSKIRVLNFENEDAERAFVVRNIVDEDVAGSDIFVLARTNRQLMDLSRQMKLAGIDHVVKEDTSNKATGDVATEGKVVLATIHAIKGLQAKKVFVIGSNEQNFPCKATDHPAIEMVKSDDYDREEEERRLFYVAISRAKKFLYITYSGKKPTYFITDEMKDIARGESEAKSCLSGVGKEVDDDIAGELKSWRAALSEERGVPAYTILTNATLNGIAAERPSNAEELMKICGIGPSKLVEYGSKILEIVSEFADEDGEEE